MLLLTEFMKRWVILLYDLNETLRGVSLKFRCKLTQITVLLNVTSVNTGQLKKHTKYRTTASSKKKTLFCLVC